MFFVRGLLNALSAQARREFARIDVFG